MKDILNELWQFLGIPQVWGIILTLIVFGAAVASKLFIKHSLDKQLDKLKEVHGELEYFRDHYAGIKEYSSSQAQALRNAYLSLFEPDTALNNEEFNEARKKAIEMIMQPMRNYLGVLDELSIKRMIEVTNFLRNFEGRVEELKNKKTTFFDITERSRRFAKADRIAYRLGLTSRTLEKWKEIKMIRVRVLKDGISILGNWTEPKPGQEPLISDDEWNSDDVQKLVKEKIIEKVGEVNEE